MACVWPKLNVVTAAPSHGSLKTVHSSPPPPSLSLSIHALDLGQGSSRWGHECGQRASVGSWTRQFPFQGTGAQNLLPGCPQPGLPHPGSAAAAVWGIPCMSTFSISSLGLSPQYGGRHMGSLGATGLCSGGGPCGRRHHSTGHGLENAKRCSEEWLRFAVIMEDGLGPERAAVGAREAAAQPC